MKSDKKQYPTPTITEVKFEDKNLVTFFTCSKQTRIEGDSVSCCNTPTGPNQVYDPS